MPPARTGSARSDEEPSPRYHVAPRGLLGFYALLSIGKKPMSGYDLMREIEEKTKRAWRPGPGSVYPVLQKLAKQGYIVVRKGPGHGPAEVIYEVTPAGLRNISRVKKAMGLSGSRLRMVSSLFVDLMEPDDLIRFASNSFELQTDLMRTLESERSGLGAQDKLFVLRQYRLNLERELARVDESLVHMGEGTGTGRRPRARGQGMRP
jgi:DNA-binding PadR family transcriptional regulator